MKTESLGSNERPGGGEAVDQCLLGGLDGVLLGSGE
jgi:hypothetical protein